jgi:hypothetical protein
LMVRRTPEGCKDRAQEAGGHQGDLQPAVALLMVSQLVWPKILVEVEVIAAKA